MDRRVRPQLSDCRLDIRLRKIVANAEQRTTVFRGDVVGEAVAEIGRCRVNPFAPTGMGLRDPSRRGGCHVDDLEAQSVDDFRDFFADVAALETASAPRIELRRGRLP